MAVQRIGLGVAPMRIYPDNLVFGYHGTSDIYAMSILQYGFRLSDQPWDWLGHASYFWEGDFDRAADWAVAKCHEVGGNPVVFKVLLDLSRCFDLTIQRFRVRLAEVAEEIVSTLPADALARMRQTKFRRDLDCHVLNTLFRTAVRDDVEDAAFTTVRGLFSEGAPLYSAGGLESGIRHHDHIQVGVLDSRAILETEITYL
ncbi:hypothetical protein ACNQP7_04600 [Mycolicibacterium fortuitum]|uniref:hypothetical protein n=1 Tax=Mycolicibacterium fortuitum TaxID=1766 RepID=UPI003AAFB0F5